MAKHNVRGTTTSNGSKSSKTAKPFGLRRAGEKKEKPGCAISREQFENVAVPLAVQIEGQEITEVAKRDGSTEEFALYPYEYATGTLGYYVSGFTTMVIDGEEVEVTVDFKVYLNGSKPRS